MKVSELARESGISVASIKYYIRERLLPAGELTSPNQASYGTQHLERLQLIRALREVGGLGVEASRGILRALDTKGPADHAVLGHVMEALASETVAGTDDETLRIASQDISWLIDDAGWEVGVDAGARRELAAVLAVIRRIWIPSFPVQGLTPYLEAVNQLVDFERLTLARGDVDLGIEGVDLEQPSDQAVKSMILGTVLFERAFVALRRMAHEDRSRKAAVAPERP